MKRLYVVLLAVMAIGAVAWADSTYIEGRKAEITEIQEFGGLATAPSVSPSGDARVYYDSTDDKIYASKNGAAYAEMGGSSVSDTAYDATSWNGVTTIAPSKNAVRDKIESLAGGHDAVTLTPAADVILELSTQEIGLDAQLANYVLAGVSSGPAVVPTFRALVDADIPDDITITEADTLDSVCTRGSTYANTADSTTAFQILDNDEGIPILNIDTTNERVSIGMDAPTATLHVRNIEDNANVTIFNLEGKRPTPTNNDTIYIYYTLNNDNSDSFEYARTTIIAEDITDGEEEGALLFEIARGGSLETALKMSAKEIVLNEPGADRDFRVEASGVADAISIDGATGAVSLGALTAGFVQSDADGLLSVTNLVGDVSSTGNTTDLDESILLVGGSDTIFPADPDADGFLKWDDGAGALTWDSGGAGATAYDDIGDPDAATTIAFDDGEYISYESAEDTGVVLYLKSTDVDLAGDTTLLYLGFQQATDANQIYLQCKNNLADIPAVVFQIGQDGNTTIAGTLEVTGAITGNLTGNADTVTTNANLTGDVTSVGNATDITESVLEDGGTDELAITAGMMNTGTGASSATYWRGDNTWVGFYYEKGFVLETPTTADVDVPFWNPNHAITITDCYCQTQGGTSATIVVGDGTNELEAIVCDADGQADDGSIANGTFTANERMQFDVTAQVGDPDWVAFTIVYTIDPD